MRAHPDQHYGCVTYAQHGEDIVFLNIFKLLGIEHGTYLDIGAHHPTTISNTRLLYEKGWRGVNVDANPYIMHEFSRERPLDKNLNFAVTPNGESEVSLFLYSRTSGRNTIDPDEVRRMEHWASPRESILVPAITADAIVMGHLSGRWPDLLSVDIEGMDYAVLESCSFYGNNRPKVICVEVRKSSQEWARFQSLLLDRDFSVYARFGENIIFVRSDCMRILFGELT